jgi:hypothetical protein
MAPPFIPVKFRPAILKETTLAEYVVWFQDLGKGDVERVGGKNASLGEMISTLAAAGDHRGSLPRLP